MYLKLMSGENASDDDSRKQYILLSGVKSVEFHRDDPDGREKLPLSGPMAAVEFENGDSRWYPVNGNCYLMNDQGKTISSFGVSKLPRNSAEA